MNRTLFPLTILAVAMFAGAAHAQDTLTTPNGSRALRRIESRLDITWDQRVQAKAILQQERPTLQQLRKQLESEHAEMARLTTFDDYQARTIVSKYAETNANVLVEREKLRIELMAILTPAQQKKVQQLRARFGAGLDERLLTLGDNL